MLVTTLAATTYVGTEEEIENYNFLFRNIVDDNKTRRSVFSNAKVFSNLIALLFPVSHLVSNPGHQDAYFSLYFGLIGLIKAAS